MAMRPKPQVKKFQILLFPQQDAKLFYKVIFGRWFMWLAIMLFCHHLYSWAIYREKQKKEIAIEAAKNTDVMQAWRYLYNIKNKQLHRILDSALINSAIERKD
jgi:hypothetical protein